jgi:hypothetical protein
MLFDKDTQKITAVLDFDWSCVSHPFDEFFGLLYDIGCNISEKDNDISSALVSGDFTTPPANKESAENWEVAKAWNAAMKKIGVLSPSDMKGVAGILDFMRFQIMLCPWELGSSEFKKMDDEKQAEVLAKREADLVEWLEKYGY